MQQKITFSEACGMIARSTGLPRKDVDDFLRAMFATVSEIIAAGESVKIKGIGTFKASLMGERKSVDVNTGNIITLPAYTKISFTPAKALAEAVNAPFADFEAVEILAALSDEDLEAAVTDETTEPISDGDSSEDVSDSKPDEIISEPVDISEPVEAPLAPFLIKSLPQSQEIEVEHAEVPVENDSTYVTTDEDVVESETNNDDDVIVNDSLIDENFDSEDNCVAEDESFNIDDEVHEYVESEGKKQHGYRRIISFLIGFGCALLLIVAVVLLIVFLCPSTSQIIKSSFISSEEKIPTKVESIKATDKNDKVIVDSIVKPQINTSVDEYEENESNIAPTQPSDSKKVYDTVTTTRYLTTIAREHYGNQHFWPYIYEENKSKLGHPNRIRPGTKVVVPDLAKYGVDPKNPEDVKMAKQKGAQIYAKYSNK